jgi:hypothetical protein
MCGGSTCIVHPFEVMMPWVTLRTARFGLLNIVLTILRLNDDLYKLLKFHSASFYYKFYISFICLYSEMWFLFIFTVKLIEIISITFLILASEIWNNFSVKHIYDVGLNYFFVVWNNWNWSVLIRTGVTSMV